MKHRHHTYDEAKRGRGGTSGAASKQVLDACARLEPRGRAFLPPGDGAPLRVHESLLKDVVEDILEVEQGCPVPDINELCGHGPLCARRLVVRDPELRRRTAMYRNAMCRNSHIVVEAER
jgi:hypothetical protein